MALTPSGTIGMADINSALGRSSTASISFNDSQVRFLANQESGSVTMAAMRSKYYFIGTITVGSVNEGSSGLTYYGYRKGPYLPCGSITGNLGAPIQDMTGWSTNSTYIGTDPSSSIPFASNGRLKIGSGSTVAMTYNYDSKTGVYSYNNNSVAAMGAGNVGGTYTWQLASN